jgi:hypothetical protein
MMLQPGLPSLRTKNNAVDLLATNSCSVPTSVSEIVGVLGCGKGLGATGVCPKSLLDKLCDMCYDGVLKGPERREQVSLVGFAHFYVLHEEVMPTENGDGSVLKPREACMPIGGK